MFLKNKIFYCNANYRAALIYALLHLKVLEKECVNFRKVLELTWWKRIRKLLPGQLLEIGMDNSNTKVFILSVPVEKELLPRIASKFVSEMSIEREFDLIDTLKVENKYIKIGRFFNFIYNKNPFSHYFFLFGILKLIKRNLQKGAKPISVLD